MNKFYPKSLISFINDVVKYNYKYTQDGYQLSVDDLNVFDQGELANHLMSLDDYDLYSITENKKSSVIFTLMNKLLKENTYDSKVDFATELREGIIEFYKPAMQELINYALSELETDDRYNAGFVRSQRKENGELYWETRV